MKNQYNNQIKVLPIYLTVLILGLVFSPVVIRIINKINDCNTCDIESFDDVIEYLFLLILWPITLVVFSIVYIFVFIVWLYMYYLRFIVYLVCILKNAR